MFKQINKSFQNLVSYNKIQSSQRFLFCSQNDKFFENQVKDLDYLMERVYPQLKDYIRANDDKNTKVINYQPPTELKQKMNITLPKKTQDLDNVVQGIENTLKYSVRTSNPKFYNQLYAGSGPVGQVGEFVSGVLNTAVHTYAVAPVMAMMEVECIRATAEVMGFDTEQADGLLVPGGTYANMSALMIARHKKFPHVRLEGYKQGEYPVVFTSPQSHYSIKRAAMMAGIGMNAVQQPECDINGNMDPESLDQLITQAKQNGQTPFFVNATSGSTVMGGYDNIEAIAKVCKKHSIWLHVDGCYGGAAIFSETHRYKMKGVEQADSVSLNFHKALSVPVQNCILVTNQHKGLLQEANASGAVYLFHKHEASDFDLGDKSLQCGRRSDAVKLWLCWQKEGNEGFGKQVDIAFENAQYFKQQIINRGIDRGFHLITEPIGGNVCFFYVPKAFRNYVKNGGDISKIYTELNTITPLIYKRMQRAGNMLVNYNPLNDKGLPYFFRIVFIQQSTTHQHSEEVLDEFERLGEDIAQKDIDEHIQSLKLQ